MLSYISEKNGSTQSLFFSLRIEYETERFPIWEQKVSTYVQKLLQGTLKWKETTSKDQFSFQNSKVLSWTLFICFEIVFRCFSFIYVSSPSSLSMCFFYICLCVFRKENYCLPGFWLDLLLGFNFFLQTKHVFTEENKCIF